jgi:hypothetical protein
VTVVLSFVLTFLLTFFLWRFLPLPTKIFLITVLITVLVTMLDTLRDAASEKLNESRVTGADGKPESSTSTPPWAGVNSRPETSRLVPPRDPTRMTEAISPAWSGAPRKRFTGTVAGLPKNLMPTDPVPMPLAGGHILLLASALVQRAVTEFRLEVNPGWRSRSTDVGSVEKPVTPEIETAALAAAFALLGVSVTVAVPPPAAEAAEAAISMATVRTAVIIGTLRTIGHATRRAERDAGPGASWLRQRARMLDTGPMSGRAPSGDTGGMASTRIAVPTRRRGGGAETQFPGRVAALPSEHQNRLLDELSETHAAMMDAVVEGDGISRVAELAAATAGGPVAVLIPRLGVACAPREVRTSGDLAALERWVEERVRGRPSAVPVEVVAEAPIRFKDEIVGVVALLRSENAPRPEVSEYLRLAAAAALTALAIEDAKEETEQHLRGSLLEELRSRRDLTGPEIVRRAARLGCDLSGGAAILCAELTVDRPRLVVAMIVAEHPGALAQELDGAGPDARPRVYAALPAVGTGHASEPSMARARRLAARVRRFGTVGMSSFHADPAELGCAVREAELVLGAMQHSGMVITDEIGTGIYKLLVRVLASHPEEVQEFYESTVAAMVRYDELNQTELVHTLWAYVDANCNMNATAAAIFTHRHTVMHRLERIRDLTGLDPTLCCDREALGLGLKVHRLLAPGLAR